MINVIMHRSQPGLKREKQLSCYARQFQKYERLASNYAEAIDSAGCRRLARADPPHLATDLLDNPDLTRGPSPRPID
jgi:hypothetical protein